MQPNQNMNNMQNRTFNRNNTPRPLQAPGYANPAVNNPNGAINPGDNVVFQDKPKKSHASIYGMIFLAILAAGGIGFGVWSMLDSNAKLAKKDETIQDLNNQLTNTSQTTVVDDTTVNLEGNSSNPIITAVSPAEYKVLHSLPVIVNGNNNSSLTITTTNGSNPICTISNLANGNDCSINGLPDGVYKIATINESQGIGYEKIGFLMNDGSVWFAPIYTSIESPSANNNLTVQKANIDGFVKDIINITYTPDVNSPTGGATSTVFVMSDNSIVKYDESMF